MQGRVMCSVAVGVFLGLLATQTHAGRGDPYADQVVAWSPGSGGAGGFDDPFTTLGSPERFTGEGVFPGVVSPFNPAFGTDELVSIGTGGFLTVSFDTPVTDDAANPWGIDLLIFGNTGFVDAAFPNGIVGGLFGNDGGTVELSADGTNWVEATGILADGLFPTMGYLDSGPYDTTQGNILTDFTRPLDPSLSFADFDSLDYQGLQGLYGGSGGGVGIDIGSFGLSSISFVRVSNSGSENVEIDAFSDVSVIPAPGGLLLLGLFALRGRRHRI